MHLSLPKVVQLQGMKAGWEITSTRAGLLGQGGCSPEASPRPLHTPCGFYYLGQKGFKYLRAPLPYFLWNTISQSNRSSCGEFLLLLSPHFLSRFHTELIPVPGHLPLLFMPLKGSPPISWVKIHFSQCLGTGVHRRREKHASIGNKNAAHQIGRAHV